MIEIPIGHMQRIERSALDFQAISVFTEDGLAYVFHVGGRDAWVADLREATGTTHDNGAD